MYVPLRVHSHHSMLTGVDAAAVLLERAAQLGLPALALTDVDGISGLVDFLLAARLQRERDPERAVRPIVGAEISDPGGAPGRLVALVRDAGGYRNLCKLVSARQLGRDPGEFGADLPGAEAFDRVHGALRYRDGLIFLVDHPRLLLALFGRVPRDSLFVAISPAALRKHSTRGREDRARSGEVRNAHLLPARRREPTPAQSGANGDTEQGDESEIEAPKVPPPPRCVPALELIEAARAVGVATVAVPDVYYALPQGRRDHRVRVAIKHNALLEGLPESWLAEEPAHLPSAQEMGALYADLPEVSPGLHSGLSGDPPERTRVKRLPGALRRSLTIAEACRYTPELGGVLLPKIELAAGESAYSKLCAAVFQGVRRRYQPLRPEVLRRIDYELSTIDALGFAPYFLLVERIAAFAAREGIPYVGRGSAADSLVAYALGLTEADPLRYKLPFERFLNPERHDRPDIDLDFCWRRRDEVLEHVYELFGAERTAMIATLNCFGPRAAFREAALVAGIPPAEVNRWSGCLPYLLPLNTATEDADPASRRVGGGREPAPELAHNSLARAFELTPEARDFPFDDERYRRVLRSASRLLNTPRHYGLHPGGVVVSPGPITDFVACQRARKGVVVTQFDKDAVEALGLVKMDLLGNRSLTVIDDCLAELRRQGIEIDISQIPEDDSRTAETLRTGGTLGCFQVESPGMRNLLKQTGAKNMDDVIQAVALIRPGPASAGMKDAYVRRFRGREQRAAPHPRLTELLWDTYGVMLYQEDVMQAAALMAGMELAEADQLRRALQKRRMHELRPLRRRFLEKCRQQGIARADAERVWELIANFASFAFCKAHAITYGQIAYRTVWLKTHHPAVFLTAFLCSETGYYKARVYVEEARRLGVAILAPDVNRSAEHFSTEWIDPPRPAVGRAAPATAALRIGLGRIKGITQKTLEVLLRKREEGPFLSLPDFLDRTAARTDETESLIQAGAFDTFDRTRPELLWRLHLLRTPQRRAPRSGGLDAGQLAACQATPESRRQDILLASQAHTGGWSERAGLGLTRAELAPGESAALFPAPPTPALVLPGLPDTDRRTRGALEFELLGLTVDAHPVEIFPCPADERIGSRRARDTTRPINPTACRDVNQRDGGRVTLRGWPAATRRVRTSDGRWMRFLTLEDESGIAEVVLFPDVYERDGHHLRDFGCLCITGVVRDQMGACTLEAERIW